MKRTMTKLGLTAAVSLGVVAIATTSAYANDLTLTYTNNGGYSSQGRWTDAVDTLCARTELPDTLVKIVPVNGVGTTFSVTQVHDTISGWSTWKCTGNLSIPEDKQYRMEIWTSSTLGGAKTLKKSGTFYS
jgi:hypothetical protein